MAKAKVVSLDERLRAETAKAAPSMIPEAVTPPPPKTDKIPDLKDVITSPADRLKVLRLIQDAQPFKQMASQAKKALEMKRPELGGLNWNDAIKDILGRYKVAKAEDEGVRLNYYRTTKKVFSVKKALDLNVSPEILAQCWDEVESYTLRVTPQGQKEEEEG